MLHYLRPHGFYGYMQRELSRLCTEKYQQLIEEEEELNYFNLLTRIVVVFEVVAFTRSPP